MPLTPSCSRGPEPVAAGSGGWECETHGSVLPLWRPEQASYAAFGEHLLASAGLPTYLPWPIADDWRVSDFGVVGDGAGAARGTVACCSGTTTLDGPVDVMVVAEEAGTGVGAFVAGVVGSDPGPEVGAGPPHIHLRVANRQVALWGISEIDGEATDRGVFVGEAEGRWLWLVLRPASAMLMLREEWHLHDVSQMGPSLVELSFGGPAPGW